MTQVTVTAIVQTDFDDLVHHRLSNGKVQLVGNVGWNRPTVMGHPEYRDGWRAVYRTMSRRDILFEGPWYDQHSWEVRDYATPWHQGMMDAIEHRYYLLRKDWRQAMVNY